jgi:hypothetical protein
MKPIYAFPIVFILLANALFGQEYVANGSFEVFSACPTALGQIALADGWTVPPNTGISSPDYFNACAGPPVGVPANLTGNQNAFDGDAYAGIAVHSSIGNYREYVQTQFATPLVAGGQYLVSFRVSAAGSGFSNNIGAVISSTQPYGDGTFHPIDATPQINSSAIISNVIGWTEISGTYIAAGGEAFLTIGNFFDDAATSVSGNPTAYYYVDDVSIAPITMGLINFDRRGLTVYPTPFTDLINIVYPAEAIKTIAVYSTFGKVHAELNANTINLSHLPTGIYCMVLMTENGHMITKKIQKE